MIRVIRILYDEEIKICKADRSQKLRDSHGPSSTLIYPQICAILWVLGSGSRPYTDSCQPASALLPALTRINHSPPPDSEPNNGGSFVSLLHKARTRTPVSLELRCFFLLRATEGTAVSLLHETGHVHLTKARLFFPRRATPGGYYFALLRGVLASMQYSHMPIWGNKISGEPRADVDPSRNLAITLHLQPPSQCLSSSWGGSSQVASPLARPLA